MWGTLSFIKTLNSVRQMGARFLCVCYISMRCIEGREDSVTERPVPAPASAHAGESPAPLRDSPPLLWLPGSTGPAKSRPSSPLPGPGPNWKPSPDAAVKLL